MHGGKSVYSGDFKAGQEAVFLCGELCPESKSEEPVCASDNAILMPASVLMKVKRLPLRRAAGSEALRILQL